MSPMNNRLLVPQKLPLLLDYAPGAAAAYSLRALSNSYVGPVVTVRRSTDSAEADFTATEVSDGTLAAWCGGGDGFVKQWWDQSGNARHASNSTSAQQPKVCSAGVVILEGGKPAVSFDGTDDRLQTGAFSTSASCSAFAVAKASQWSPPSQNRALVVHAYTGAVDAGVAYFVLLASTYADWLAGDVIAFGDGYQTSQYPKAVGPIPSGTDNRFLSSILGPSAAAIFVNGAYVSTRKSVAAAVAADSGPLTVGANGGTVDRWLGTISEVIIYPRDMTAERQLVEGNLAWYY